VFLLIASRRSARPADDRHPLGYGREAYVWSLLAAVGLFAVGASVSVWHGVSELMHGEEEQGGRYAPAYVTLAIAFVLEGISFLQAFRQLRREARGLDRDLLSHALETSDPTVRAVFAEDAAALVGILIAAVGIALHQFTGVVAWDAMGSILIGVLLGVVAVLLIDRNRRFLTGEPGSDELREAAIARIKELRDVAEVRFIRLEFVGPKQLFVVASVDLVGDPVESSVAKTLRRLERDLESSPYVVEAVLTVSEPDDAGSQGR
jgi:cation diffusion facilitator family transporter